MKIFIFFSTMSMFTGAYSSEVGRYQIFHNPNVRADTFLLDTATGKMWIRPCISRVSKADEKSECAISAWVSDDVVGVSVKEKDFWKKVVEYEAAHP